MRFCKIHRAPSSRRLLFSHLDSPLEQLHPHPASENCERNARNKYVLSVFWAHHPTKNALTNCACFSASALSLPSSVGAVVAAGSSFKIWWGEQYKHGCLSVLFYLVLSSGMCDHCDIVIYSAMLLGRLALIDSLHFILQKHQQPSNQKLKQPS